MMQTNKNEVEILHLLKKMDQFTDRIVDTAELPMFEPFTEEIDQKIEMGLAMLCESDRAFYTSAEAEVFDLSAARTLVQTVKAQTRLQLALNALKRAVMEERLKAAG